MIGCGIALGVIGALAGTRALSSLLFGIKHSDPGTYALVALALASIGIAACLGPARRATRMDPLSVLKSD